MDAALNIIWALIREGRLLNFLDYQGALIRDGRLKDSGRLFESLRYSLETVSMLIEVNSLYRKSEWPHHTT